jgi:hypothetical protein
MRVRIHHVALALALAACSKQSYDEGMKLVCESTKHATTADGKPSATLLVKWLNDHVKNDEAHQVVVDWVNSDESRGQKLRRLSDAVTRAGIADADCPFLLQMRGQPTAAP